MKTWNAYAKVTLSLEVKADDEAGAILAAGELVRELEGDLFPRATILDAADEIEVEDALVDEELRNVADDPELDETIRECARKLVKSPKKTKTAKKARRAK